MMRVLGVDPGTRKVGLAVVDSAAEAPLALEIVSGEGAPERAAALAAQYAVEAVALGRQTGARAVAEGLRRALAAGPTLRLVDERHSSYEARALYWRLNPPRGLARLLPEGMRVPPEPIDAYAAAVIARRFLTCRGVAK
ncbi:MAG: Holliday junction resolvase RuvX [bacterium]|nr:Holliday junction resolvase RuvX [bacterium]